MTNEQKMREALSLVREALQLANDTPNGGVTDTIWMPHTPQTLFDFIDEALAQQPAAGVELTDDEIESIAHRSCSIYVHARDRVDHRYEFGRLTVFDFATKLIAAHIAKQGGAA